MLIIIKPNNQDIANVNTNAYKKPIYFIDIFNMLINNSPFCFLGNFNTVIEETLGLKLKTYSIMLALS